MKKPSCLFPIVGQISLSMKRRTLVTASKSMQDARTIYALSSGTLPSAIAVLRITGNDSRMALKRLTKRSTDFENMRMFYTRIHDCSGKVLDHALACFMEGPKTFTGADSAELYLHGSPALLNEVYAALSSMGLESARAGEFTRRAFFNGKLSAAQVESLSDLIYAKTSSQLHLAKNQERAGTYIKPLKERVMRLLVMLEAEIDFAEDICSDNELNLTKFLTEIHAIAAELRKFLRSAHRGSLIRSGVNIALVGRTNVGKSSIMNKLAEKELAITSPFPGTTRDPVETSLNIDSFLVNMVDVAGIRETSDPVELEGIRRALSKCNLANILVFVLDAGSLYEHSVSEELESLFAEVKVDTDEQILVVCINKSDLVTNEEKIEIEKGLVASLNLKIRDLPLVWTSCLEETGVFSLIAEIGRLLQMQLSADGDASDIFISRSRHIECIRMALASINEIIEFCIQPNDPAIASHYLRECINSIGEIAGTVVNEEIMNDIFSQFCIGK